jgi:GrpB-like predicted nucleotidyltransferase (UPF0157 family)
MQGGELERHPSLSDRRDPAINVVPYDPEWVGEFEREAAAIRDALSDVLVRIEHVGSTAVPGLPAKPIIDIQVSVGNIRERDSFVLPLERLGYLFAPDPDSPDYHFFGKPAERPAATTFTYVPQEATKRCATSSSATSCARTLRKPLGTRI